MLFSIFMPVENCVFLWDLCKFLVEVFEEAEGRGRRGVLILHLTHIKLSLVRVSRSNDVTSVIRIDPPYRSFFANLQVLCLHSISG